METTNTPTSMNLNCFPRTGRLLTGIFVFLLTATASFAQTNDVPTGTLNVDRNMVRAGVNSQLDWNITYPSGITEIIEIIPPNTIVPKKNLKMKIRVLGASFQQTATKYLPVQAYWSKNNGSWSQLFYGYQTSVRPQDVLVSTNVKANDKINIGGRGYRSGWLPFYHTGGNAPNLVLLTDGDSVPSTVPAFYQANIEDFLAPYLDSNRKINIGERDLIILIELGQTNPSASGFDIQDLVLLVTFE